MAKTLALDVLAACGAMLWASDASGTPGAGGLERGLVVPERTGNPPPMAERVGRMAAGMLMAYFLMTETPRASRRGIPPALPRKAEVEESCTVPTPKRTVAARATGSGRRRRPNSQRGLAWRGLGDPLLRQTLSGRRGDGDEGFGVHVSGGLHPLEGIADVLRRQEVGGEREHRVGVAQIDEPRQAHVESLLDADEPVEGELPGGGERLGGGRGG